MRLPQQLQRAMAAEAEASREARAKVCLFSVSFSLVDMSSDWELLRQKHFVIIWCILEVFCLFLCKVS